MVSGLEVRGVTVKYGPTVAVDNVSLRVEPGTVVGLLGASGSGKSTLLRAIAGLQPLSAGQILWDGEDLAPVKVHKRNFGLVFQDGQLFPTMTVAKNIAYGLGKLPKPEQKARVEEMLELVGLAGYGDRKPTELSGGQAQRVALARSLAPSPRALLLDEPLSALDTALRRRLADDLARILRETHTTGVYVTHDHQEAYTIADYVAVLDEGHLLQLDSPEALRGRPRNKQVAAFLGYRAFVTEAEAHRLGWRGTLGTGEVLGIGPASLQLDSHGFEVDIIDQTLTIDDWEVKVALPDGQTATVSSPSKVDSLSVRVTLVGGAVVPA
ncbi:MAG: ABC transporter ATP-binding protein [Propionibacteriaceae bacterium]|nr:ABC transporter ATP-binding protein [Propionibacteriaceae bacterium]